jgi:hypothetical protein
MGKRILMMNKPWDGMNAMPNSNKFARDYVIFPWYLFFTSSEESSAPVEHPCPVLLPLLPLDHLPVIGRLFLLYAAAAERNRQLHLGQRLAELLHALHVHLHDLPLHRALLRLHVDDVPGRGREHVDVGLGLGLPAARSRRVRRAPGHGRRRRGGLLDVGRLLCRLGGRRERPVLLAHRAGRRGGSVPAGAAVTVRGRRLLLLHSNPKVRELDPRVVKVNGHGRGAEPEDDGLRRLARVGEARTEGEREAHGARGRVEEVGGRELEVGRDDPGAVGRGDGGERHEREAEELVVRDAPAAHPELALEHVHGQPPAGDAQWREALAEARAGAGVGRRRQRQPRVHVLVVPVDADGLVGAPRLVHEHVQHAGDILLVLQLAAALLLCSSSSALVAKKARRRLHGSQGEIDRERERLLGLCLDRSQALRVRAEEHR